MLPFYKKKKKQKQHFKGKVNEINTATGSALEFFHGCSLMKGNVRDADLYDEEGKEE